MIITPSPKQGPSTISIGWEGHSAGGKGGGLLGGRGQGAGGRGGGGKVKEQLSLGAVVNSVVRQRVGKVMQCRVAAHCNWVTVTIHQSVSVTAGLRNLHSSDMGSIL